MSDRPFKVQMNQDGAILKPSKTEGSSFHVIPDYIKLEEAAYPRMSAIDITPWVEETPPDENYGKHVIDTTIEVNKYYTFYCEIPENSEISDNIDTSGDGSMENPWKNFIVALNKLSEYKAYACCHPLRLIVKGDVYYPSSLSLVGEAYKWGWRLHIDWKDARFMCVDSESGLGVPLRSLYMYNLKMYATDRLRGLPYQIREQCIYNVTVYGEGLTDHSEIEFVDCIIYNIVAKGSTFLEILLTSAYYTAYTEHVDATVYGFNSLDSSICSDADISSRNLRLRGFCSHIRFNGVPEDRPSVYPKYIYNSTLKGMGDNVCSGYWYNTTLIAQKQVGSWTSGIVTIDYSPYVCNCTFDITYMYTGTSSVIDFEVSGVTIYEGAINKSTIKLSGTLPNTEVYAIACPLKILPIGDSTPLVIDCDLIGYASTGSVPEDVIDSCATQT